MLWLIHIDFPQTFLFNEFELYIYFTAIKEKRIEYLAVQHNLQISDNQDDSLCGVFLLHF